MYDITKEKAVRKHKRYYHVSAVENIERIQKRGIKADRNGYIFVFTHQIVADPIAKFQCILQDKYAEFMIDSKGITGKVIMDRVTEFTASYQRIIIQDKISPKYIRFMYSTIVTFDKPTEWDLFVLRKYEGLTKKEAEKVFYERLKERNREISELKLRKHGGFE